MFQLTVGEVAGLISVGVQFFRLTQPLLQVVVLVGILSNQNTAITWSVVGRFIQSTPWPTLLMCDTESGRKDGVRSRVFTTISLAFFGNMLIAIAGISTPIGLYEQVVTGSTVNATFEYVPDPSPMGRGTPSRDDYVFSRSCLFDLTPCSDMYNILGSIPQNLTAIFGDDGSDSKSMLSSLFDIQFRQYFSSKANTTGVFAMSESVALVDRFAVREGLVIDGINGGIGFRNHSVPSGLEWASASTWKEELLFIEPVTECHFSNWTLQYRFISPSSGKIMLGSFGDAQLELRGAPATQIPAPSPLQSTKLNSDPLVLERAETAAKIFNYHLSNLLGLNSSIGSSNRSYDILSNLQFSNLSEILLSPVTSFPATIFGWLGDDIWDPNLYRNPSILCNDSAESWVIPTVITLDPNAFNLSEFNVTAFEILLSNYSSSLAKGYSVDEGMCISQIPGAMSTSMQGPYGTWKIPESTKDYTFSNILNSCKGYSVADSISMHRRSIDCGYLMSPPKAVSGSFAAMDGYFEQDIHVCSSAVRATVKEVTFVFNTSTSKHDLEALSVTQIARKNYTSTKTRPVWGVENPGEEWNLTSFIPFWGLIKEIDMTLETISAVQSEDFYLPAWSYIDPVTGISTGGFSSSDSMAAAQAFTLAFSHLWNSPPSSFYIDSSYFSSVFSGTESAQNYYSGSNDRRMLNQWYNFTSSASTIPKIPNLIWTDMVANMVVGTKSPLDVYPDKIHPVQTYVRRISYDIRYGIPAIICIAIWLIYAIIALGMLVSSSTRNRIFPSTIRRIINSLSVGRALALLPNEAIAQLNIETKEWLELNRSTNVHIPVVEEQEYSKIVEESSQN